MKNSSTFRYLIYLIVYSSLLIIGFKIEGHLHVRAEENFLLSSVFYYAILFPVFFGILMAIPMRGYSLKNNGSWLVNWKKLIIFGIPSLLVLLFPAYYFTLFTWGDFIPFANLLYGNEKLHFFSGIIFGFTIVYSIEKKEQIIKQDFREDEAK